MTAEEEIAAQSYIERNTTTSVSSAILGPILLYLAAAVQADTQAGLFLCTFRADSCLQTLRLDITAPAHFGRSGMLCACFTTWEMEGRKWS